MNILMRQSASNAIKLLNLLSSCSIGYSWLQNMQFFSFLHKLPNRICEERWNRVC